MLHYDMRNREFTDVSDARVVNEEPIRVQGADISEVCGFDPK